MLAASASACAAAPQAGQAPLERQAELVANAPVASHQATSGATQLPAAASGLPSEEVSAAVLGAPPVEPPAAPDALAVAAGTVEVGGTAAGEALPGESFEAEREPLAGLDGASEPASLMNEDHADDLAGASPPCIRDLGELLAAAPPRRVAGVPGIAIEELAFEHYKIEPEFKRYFGCRFQEQTHAALAKGERWYFPLIEAVARREAPALLDAGSDALPLLRPLQAKMVVESLAQTNAVSWAGAAGPWQFMRPTMQRMLAQLGQADPYPLLDLRYDWEQATRAALRLNLENLRIFQYTRTPLACAVMAYNAGAGRVAHALANQRRADCAGLRHSRHSVRRWIPSETYHYHPRVLLTLLLMSWRQAHGYTLTPAGDLPGSWVAGAGSVRLGALAAAVGLEERELLALNRLYPLGVTPAEPWRLRVPPGAAGAVAAALADQPRLTAEEVARLTRQAGEFDHALALGEEAFRYYRVRGGDTVSQICQRFGLSLWKIYKLNEPLFERNRRRSGQRWMIYPGQRLRLPALHTLVNRS